MRHTKTHNGRGDSAALHMLSGMLTDLFNAGSAKAKPKARRKVFAVMPNGERHEISNCRSSGGWNCPGGRSFSSRLSSAKASWVAAGATIETVTA